MYVAGYTFMRFWIERVRIDEAWLLWGWRVNEVVSLAVFAVAVVYLLVDAAPRPELVGDAVATVAEGVVEVKQSPTASARDVPDRDGPLASSVSVASPRPRWRTSPGWPGCS